MQNPAELPRLAGPRADVAAFELLTQALVGITAQSLRRSTGMPSRPGRTAPGTL